jgi:hypothetical protein
MLSRFTLGDTFSLTSNLSEYPASDGWTLKHRFVPRAGAATPIEITCTSDGDAHVALVAAAVTAEWDAGTYTFASYVEDGAGETHTTETGELILLPDPREATTLDTRTDAAVALDNVRAMLQGVASKNVQRYEINGRSLEHYSIPDLIALEAKLVSDVKREQNAVALAAGNGSRRKIFARVGRV